VDQEKETAYVSFGPHIYAVNLQNGTQKWRFPSEADNKVTFYAVPAMTEDEQLVVGSYDRQLYSLNPANGTENWTFSDASNIYVAGPLTHMEKIFAPSSDNFLYALDLAGAVRWKFETEDYLWATPAANGENVYLPSMDHKLYALQSATGNLVWATEDLGGSIPGKPTLSAEGLLYFGTFASELIAIQSESGQIVWRTPTSGWVWSGPLLVDGVLYFGDLEGIMYAVDASDGSILWQVQPDTSDKREITGKPVLIGDTVYFAAKSGNIFAVDATSGATNWTKTLEGEIYADLVAVEETILIAPIKTDPLLIALDANGTQRWAFTPEK